MSHPKHPEYDGRPILLGDVIKGGDEWHSGTVTGVHSARVSSLTGEPDKVWLSVDSAPHAMVTEGMVVAHYPAGVVSLP